MKLIVWHGADVQFFGIDWVGINPENGRKLMLSAVFVIAILVTSGLVRWLVGRVLARGDYASTQTKFWTRQGFSLMSTIFLILGLLSIWFNDPTRLATAFGLVSAGLAFALQQVVTSVAGYFVILRGSTFTVGDRISMGGVRGDVVRLGFIQTTIMEMGQPPSIQGADPAMWVKSRQFTGRIVTVANAKIFAEPVFNYTRDFPFIWEEMAIPITYQADRGRVEEIMLEAAKLHGIDPNAMASEAKADLQVRLGIEPIELDPRVFFRITDNWLELTVRFIAATHQIRGVKDAMSRHIIVGLDKAGIGIASATYDIVGFPPVELRASQVSQTDRAIVP
ncbi:mechanosensitive ion channel [Bradyrhizobium sp. 2]|uniref:mechanosensitive ion channel family protein n=1 Tax=Bradyrhizobium sp. 2 TaxID=190045 RepID=UPI001FFB1893|nr:mechanosensitive ion channel domain-containing protein [Bradyrhizobium sp. 2]MCK1462984.1 mechanosensitive ion channel [Bradyrhizobium sp. 2]